MVYTSASSPVFDGPTGSHQDAHLCHSAGPRNGRCHGCDHTHGVCCWRFCELLPHPPAPRDGAMTGKGDEGGVREAGSWTRVVSARNTCYGIYIAFVEGTERRNGPPPGHHPTPVHVPSSHAAASNYILPSLPCSMERIEFCTVCMHASQVFTRDSLPLGERASVECRVR
jgi:hypothetical protein